MANPENLKPFVPGDPRRINKPKGAKSMSTWLRLMLNKRVEVEDPFTKKSVKMPLSQLVSLSLIKKASSGNVPAITEIMDRLEGKVASPAVRNINLNGTPDDPNFRDEFFGVKPKADK